VRSEGSEYTVEGGGVTWHNPSTHPLTALPKNPNKTKQKRKKKATKREMTVTHLNRKFSPLASGTLVTCDLCLREISHSVRIMCAECVQMDVCAECFAKGKVVKLIHTIYGDGGDWRRREEREEQ